MPKLMGYATGLLVAAVAAGGLVFARAAAPKVKGPGIEFAKTSIDIGDLPAGDSKELGFPVRNVGSELLRISSVDGGCGCVQPTFPETLKPGQSGEVHIKFEPGAAWGGKTEKHIQVMCNDPRNPKAELLLTANVVPFVSIEPSTLITVDYHRGGTYTKEVELVPRKGSNLVLKEPTSDIPEVHPSLVPPAPHDPRRAYKVKLQIGPCPGPGDWVARIEVKTSEPRMPTSQFVIAGLAADGPVASPRQVFLPTAPRLLANKQVARIQVLTRSGKLRIVRVDTGSPDLTSNVITRIADRAYEVQIFQKDEWKPGVIKSNIRVITDDKTTPEIMVPFHATVR